MKTVAVHDRPREKLERVGVSAVGDNELLAIVLGHGAARASVLELANLVLDAAGGLHGLARATPDDLRRIPGIGRGRAAIVLFHNHPSGDPRPSEEDVRLTKRLLAAGQLMGIDVLDHVIISETRYYSMKETRTLDE